MGQTSLPDGILWTARLVHYGLIHIFPTSEKEDVNSHDINNDLNYMNETFQTVPCVSIQGLGEARRQTLTSSSLDL